MAKRPTLKLSRSGTDRSGTDRGGTARGGRPSRRAAVRTRATRDARGRKQTAPRSRQAQVARGVMLHVAMKRALRKGALRDCSQRCVYCATPLDQHTATLDHVVPLARGGAHDPGNVVAACGPCNRLKGDLLPFEFFARHPWAGLNFVRFARNVHRALKRGARRAVSLACARETDLAA
ncbi:MAG: HNH endonuclease [Gemmatimonadaceae bacterium]|nr:HNH endonuclease [Gemmatimonadaceae bacterium]